MIEIKGIINGRPWAEESNQSKQGSQWTIWLIAWLIVVGVTLITLLL